jgi:hypothetical protein
MYGALHAPLNFKWLFLQITVRFEVFMTAAKKNIVFWVLVEVY